MHSVPDSAGETNHPLSHKFIQSLLTKDKGNLLALQLCIQEIFDSYSDHEIDVFRGSPATVPETSGKVHRSIQNIPDWRCANQQPHQ
jgi:hypothetical protein